MKELVLVATSGVQALDCFFSGGKHGVNRLYTT
jgi:hypothetical protein